ncbi:hypothetical protein ACJX0J_030171, partial [Zea mays]
IDDIKYILYILLFTFIISSMQYIFGLKVQAVLQQKEQHNTNTARAEARKNVF